MDRSRQRARVRDPDRESTSVVQLLLTGALAIGYVWGGVPAMAGTCNVPGSHASIQEAVIDPSCTTIDLAAHRRIADRERGAYEVKAQREILGLSDVTHYFDRGRSRRVSHATIDSRGACRTRRLIQGVRVARDA